MPIGELIFFAFGVMKALIFLCGSLFFSGEMLRVVAVISSEDM